MSFKVIGCLRNGIRHSNNGILIGTYTHALFNNGNWNDLD